MILPEIHRSGPRLGGRSDAGATDGRAPGTMLERIVYVSRAATGLGLEALYAIVRAAHARNPGAGLTGGWSVLDGCFAQVLEGAAAAARPSPTAASASDPRHGAIELRAREPALCRLFPGAGAGAPDPRLPRSRVCSRPSATGPGFPVADFPSDVLVEFVVSACRREAAQRRAATLSARGARLDSVGGARLSSAPGRRPA